jgi:arylsulfatase A-like enzyme/tetratricopeptide (TPR) repeat protein
LSRPFRYTFILCLVALGTALAAVGGWRYARASAPVSGPIILISVDTLRADHLPAYGYRGLLTPALDTLAADGVVFERAYSHSPQTLPAHASLLSGRLPFETGVRDNVGFAVKDDERLVAEMLADRGYKTGAVISSYVLRRSTGIAQGFSFFEADWPAGAPAVPRAGLMRDGADSERIAERWLQSANTERAFLFLHLYDPHAPYAPPPRYEHYGSYDGEIAYVDEIVGRLLKYLKTHQLYDQSTIILLADHGEGLGDHGETQHGLLLHDEVLRVPLIIKPAAGEGAGRRVPDVVQQIDIVPTILDLAKAPIPDNLRGQSLKPLIEGTGRFPKRIVYSESLFGTYRFGWSVLASVTDGRYRLVRSPHEELFALDTDPAERHNLAGERGDEYGALKTALDQLRAPASPNSPAKVPADDAARLAALGYVGMPHAPGPSLEPSGADGVAMLETYRTAMENAVNRHWPQAIELVQAILREQPELAGLWIQLAQFNESAGRLDKAVDAYTRASASRPDDPDAHLGAASALFRLRRLEDARRHAEAAGLAADGDRRSRAAAHALLARIAVLRRDPETAREEAALARKADATLPMPAFIDGRLLFEQGRYEDALPLFEAALVDVRRPNAAPLPDLHFYAGDTLVHLERLPEAEYHFVEELKQFPENARARGALAVLYHDTGRSDEAAQALNELVLISPTPEAYDLAARLWTTFGNRRHAAALRAERSRISQ